jgi:hypothetical protein
MSQKYKNRVTEYDDIDKIVSGNGRFNGGFVHDEYPPNPEELTGQGKNFKYKWRRAIEYDQEMHGTTHHILVTLTEHGANDGSRVYPSIERVSWGSKRTPPTIIEHLKRARDAGWISWERIPNPLHERGWVTLYTLHIPEGKEAPEGSKVYPDDYKIHEI